MGKPLEGIRVIDFCFGQQGPVATAMLGDMGAEVIHIEPPEGDANRAFMKVMGMLAVFPDGRNFYFETNNRSKKSLALNLKTEVAQEIMYRLVEKSDVFVTNYLPPAVKKLGFDYRTLTQHNSKLIYAAASAWGPDGPDADRPGLDFAAQAASGFMYSIGDPDSPPIQATGGLSDQMGAVILAYGIMTALVARERYGVGQMVNTSLLGSMFCLGALNVAASLMFGKDTPRYRRTDANNAFWNHYECADKKWIALAMLQGDRYWPYLVETMGLQEFERDPRFENMERRAENAAELVSVFDRIFASKTRDEWLNIFRLSKGDLIYAPVNTMSEAVQDVQAVVNDYVVEFDHPTLGLIKVPGFPVKLSKTPPGIQSAAPELGEHTELILTETLAYTWDEVSEFKARGVIP